MFLSAVFFNTFSNYFINDSFPFSFQNTYQWIDASASTSTTANDIDDTESDDNQKSE